MGKRIQPSMQSTYLASNTTDIQQKSVPNRTQQPSDAGKQVNKLYTKLNINMNAKHTKT